MAAREKNILNVPLSETLEGMHVLCDTGDTGEPYRVAASLFIAEATQAAKDAVANLVPKDVILEGFTALTAGKPAITANTTLLAAIQSLYAMVGSGKVKIVSDGADQTGMVCWNGTSASGFVINVNEAAIYTRSQWTQSNPDSVTDANWIAAVKTGGTKTPFAAAAQNPNMGDLPTNSRLKFVDNKTTILGMLKMLTAAANVGRLRIVSGNPATGASGKPELAFIVNIVQGTNAETAGTNGLQIFHLTNDYIRVIPSSSVAMAWPTLQTLTDEDVIKKLNSTASGDWGGLGMKLPWTGSSTGTALSLSRVDIDDFGDYDTLYAILNQSGDMVAILADHPAFDPSSSGGTYVGTAQLETDYSDAIIYDVYNLFTHTRYRGYVSSAGQVDWTGAHRDVANTISVSDFSPEALFAYPYNFHLYPSGTMIPIEGAQQAKFGPFPEGGYETAGYIMVQYGDNHLDSDLRQVTVVLHKVGTIAEQPGRMAYATISKDGMGPLWQFIGDSQWLWRGDWALTANTTVSFLLIGYTRRPGDRLEIYYDYLGGDTEGHIMGFSNPASVLYNPAEALTQSFFTLVTSSGSALQLEAQFEFRMSSLRTLQITGKNLSTGGVNVVSQFRIKGVKLVR